MGVCPRCRQARDRGGQHRCPDQDPISSRATYDEAGPTAPVREPSAVGESHQLEIWCDGRRENWLLPAGGDVVVGRVHADITIAAASVSRRHARISVRPGRVLLEDLGSRNGVRVNGERVAGPHALSYGDLVTFGEVLAVFERGRPASAPHSEGEIKELRLGDQVVVLADPVMRDTYRQLERLASSDLTVLIVGETGTGKELAAQAVRHGSKRRHAPFVSINCAALPDTIAESELFGYERGAFSGANRDKLGLLESASGGTVFLDEVGDLSPSVQAKLLRAIESRRVTRLGSVREQAIDVRLVAATHRDLAADVAAGRFRQDLYYRLSAAVVRLPPLRSRPQELLPLAERFLQQACQSLGHPRPMRLAPDAIAALLAHPWPGNARELKNVMEYLAATVTGDSIAGDDVRPRLQPLAPAESASAALAAPLGSFPTLPDAKKAFEKQSIEAALAATGGNKTRAAKLLGIPLRTFMSKVKSTSG
jgi:DNA-binding NtrC family response regulator